MIAGTGAQHIWNDWYEPVSTMADGDFTMLLEWLRGALLFKCWSMCMWQECLWTSFLLRVFVTDTEITFNQWNQSGKETTVYGGSDGQRQTVSNDELTQLLSLLREVHSPNAREEEEEAGPSAPTMMSLLGSLKLKRSSDKNFKFQPNSEISDWTLKTG